MSEERLEELADSIFAKLNDEEKLYLLVIHKEKNKIIKADIVVKSPDVKGFMRFFILLSKSGR